MSSTAKKLGKLMSKINDSIEADYTISISISYAKELPRIFVKFNGKIIKRVELPTQQEQLIYVQAFYDALNIAGIIQ